MVDCGFRFRTTVHFSNRTFEYSSQNCVPYLIVFPQNSSSSKRKKNAWLFCIDDPLSPQSLYSPYQFLLFCVLHIFYIHTIWIRLARVWSIPLHSFASENENVSNVCRSVNANICKEKKNSCRHTSHSLTHSYIRTQNWQRSSQQQLFRFFVGSAEKILFSTRVPLTNGLKTNIPTGVLSTWAQKLIYRHLSNANTLG